MSGVSHGGVIPRCLERHTAWGKVSRNANRGSGGALLRPAAGVVLADLEHVLWVSRPAIRFCTAERQRQPHLPDARRPSRAGTAAVDRGAAHGTPGAADRRLSL